MKPSTRKPVPCESDEHVFRPEAYDQADPVLAAERCTRCGWSLDEFADHDRPLERR